MSGNIITGVDVGSSRVRVAMFIEDNDEYFFGNSETKGIQQGSIINQAETKESVLEALHKAESSSQNESLGVILGLGGIHIEGHRVESSIGTDPINGITEEIIESLNEDIQRKIEEDFPNDTLIWQTLIEYRLDGRSVVGNPVGLICEQLTAEYFVVVCFNQYYNSILEVFDSAGIDILGKVPSPIAASTALTESQMEAGCALVDIGSRTLSITVFENKKPIFLKILPIGANSITNDIAVAFKLPLNEAERYAENPQLLEDKKGKVEKVIERRLKEIFTIVNEELKKIDKHNLLPGGIILSGGGAGITPIQEVAKSMLQLPVCIADRIRNIEFKNSSWLVAIGLIKIAQSEEMMSSKSSMKKAWRWIRNSFPMP